MKRGQISVDLFHKITAKVPRGQQGYWDIIIKLGVDDTSFTLYDIYMLTNAHSGNVSDYVKKLVKAKYLKVVDKVKSPHATMTYHYVIVKRAILAPRIGYDGTESRPTLNSFLWRIMPMLKEFDAKELAAEATTDERDIKASATNKYLQALCKAGYLTIVKKHTYNSMTKYRFIQSMFTGEQPPQIMRSKFVWDANIEKVMGGEVEFKEAA